MNKTVVILAAGKGTRVAEIMKGKNKCLIDLSNKTALEYILDHFSIDDNVILVLNEKDNHTEEFITPRIKHKVKFVYTNRQQGPGDSLSAARDLIKDKPFILWYCDTILNEELPKDFSNNFIICSNQYQENYAKYMVVPEDTIITDKSKNVFCADNLFYIGLSYIKDAELFWKLFDEHTEEFKKLCDIAFINYTHRFNKFITSEWYDVGNVNSYQIAKSMLEN